jgi:hypothetical protein
MMMRCDLHDVNIDRRGCPWCEIEQISEQLTECNKARKDAEETAGRYYEDGRKMKMESDCLREALQKIEDCDECDPEISISLLQLIAREALEDGDDE